jgi:hypothetical protein
VAVAARAEIIECLQQDEACTDATYFREQCFLACRILREEHTPRVPLELTSQGFGIECHTIYNHWRGDKARRNETKPAGRVAALSLQELDEIITYILFGFQQRRPLTLPETASQVYRFLPE